MMRIWQYVLLPAVVILSMLAASCQPSPTEPATEVEPMLPPWFLEWTAEKVLHFQHDAGPLRGGDEGETLGPHWSLYAERNQLFVNDGAGHFCDVSLSNPALCGTANIARGLAYGDIDNDGKLDLLVTPVVGSARLYHNVAAQGGHWLSVRAVVPPHPPPLEGGMGGERAMP